MNYIEDVAVSEGSQHTECAAEADSLWFPVGELAASILRVQLLFHCVALGTSLHLLPWVFLYLE